MIPRPPRSTRTDTLFPSTTLFRSEMILADIDVKGTPTKALVHFDRNGFAYTLNRETGELLVAEKYDPAVNWATHVDMERSEEHTSELQSLMRTSYAVFCLKKKKQQTYMHTQPNQTIIPSIHY